MKNYIKQILYVSKKFKKRLCSIFVLNLSTTLVDLFNVYLISWIVQLIQNRNYLYLLGLCSVSLGLNIMKIFFDKLDVVEHLELGKEIGEHYFPQFFDKIEKVDIRNLDKIEYILKLDKAKEAINIRIQNIIESTISEINIFVKFVILSFSILRLSKIIYLLILAITVFQVLYGVIRTKNEIAFEDKKLFKLKKYNYMKDILDEKRLVIEQRVIGKIEQLYEIKKKFFCELDKILNNYGKKWCIVNSAWAIFMFSIEYAIFRLLFSLALSKKIMVSEVVFLINSQVSIVQTVEMFISNLMNIGIDSSYYGEYEDILKNSSSNEILDSKKNETKELINLSNVWVSYVDEDYILKNVSLSIDKGKKYMIIGKNGSGKSTLAQILSGILKPNMGTINFNFNEKDISYIVQDFNKYYIKSLDSIYFDRNVNYKHIDYSRVRRDRLAEILESNKYLGTQYYEDGVDLSEGQWQKLAFIRGAVYNKKLIILDEATSKFDVFSKRKYMEIIFENSKDKTIILVNHDLKMVEKVDEVILMSQGEILAKGSHIFLLNTCEEYREMIEKRLQII